MDRLPSLAFRGSLRSAYAVLCCGSNQRRSKAPAPCSVTVFSLIRFAHHDVLMKTREEVGDRYLLQDEVIRAGIEGGGFVGLAFHDRIHQDRNCCSRFPKVADQPDPTSSSRMGGILRAEVELHQDRVNRASLIDPKADSMVWATST
jgi:hypothetical protein